MSIGFWDLNGLVTARLAANFICQPSTLFPLDISENYVIIGVVMAQKGKKTSAAGAGSGKGDVGLPFGKTNMILFAFGLLSVILGFITLASGSETLAPILLVLGYCVIIPLEG
jgi:hypothetical protein